MTFLVSKVVCVCVNGRVCTYSSGPVHVAERLQVHVRARTNHQIPTDHRRSHAAGADRSRQGRTTR